MAFSNPPPSQVKQLLREARNVAIVGLSGDPGRPSFRVARALQGYGYRILPVNPRLETVLGERAYPTLEAALAALPAGETIDIVDVFRKPEHVGPIVDEALRLGLPALWLQEEVIDEPAATRARQGGMLVVMDRCLYKARAAL